MRADAATGLQPWVAFAAGVLAIGVGSRAAAASAAFRAHPRLVGAAVALDLTLTAALLAWWTVVRTRRVSPGFLVAVISAGAWAASHLLPLQDAAAVSSAVRGVVALAELACLWLVARAALRLRRSVRDAGEALPIEELLRAAARRAVGDRRAVDALVTELSFVGMALFSWRSAPHVPGGTLPFSVHRRGGVAAVHAALLLAATGETIGVHLVLSHWSVRAAWIATALSAWMAVWLVGDLRALKLRPVLLHRDRLQIRIGLRWRVTIPLDSIRSVCGGPDPVRHRGCAIAAPLGSPNLYLHLVEPVAVEGVIGLRRRGDCVGLQVDEPAALRAALERLRPALAVTR